MCVFGVMGPLLSWLSLCVRACACVCGVVCVCVCVCVCVRPEQRHPCSGQQKEVERVGGQGPLPSGMPPVWGAGEVHEQAVM